MSVMEQATEQDARRSPLDRHDMSSETMSLPGYLLRLRMHAQHTCDFDLVRCWPQDDGSRVYPTDEHNPDRNAIGPVTASLAQAEIAVEGFVNWDGCTQFWTQQVHVEDRTDLQQWLDAIAAARRVCAERLGQDVLGEYAARS